MSQGNLPHIHLDSVVKIKSLPFDATQLDIIHFFEMFRLKPNGVQLVVRADNRPTGEAFVDFENFEEAARAVREKDHKVFSAEKFGDRYVRLLQVRTGVEGKLHPCKALLPAGSASLCHWTIASLSHVVCRAAATSFVPACLQPYAAFLDSVLGDRDSQLTLNPVKNRHPLTY